MTSDDPGEAIHKARTAQGTETVIEYLNDETALDEQYQEMLDAAVDEIGESRVRQVLGADGEPWLTLYMGRAVDDPDVLEQKEAAEDLLFDVWEEGGIANYDMTTIPTRVSSVHRSRNNLELFKKCRSWAGRNNRSLRPGFEMDEEYVHFPPLFLVVRDSHDRLFLAAEERPDGAQIRGVFPHAHDGRVQSIRDCLIALRDGEEILPEHPPEEALNTHTDLGPHGAIKGHLYRYPARTVGAEWEPVGVEVATGNQSEDDRGRIDLLFAHRNQSRYLIAEVKSSAEQVDKAFGQAYRYKHRFTNDRYGITPDQIEMAIAAPQFYSAHESAADELNKATDRPRLGQSDHKTPID